MTNWSDWSGCSATCGGGVNIRLERRWEENNMTLFTWIEDIEELAYGFLPDVPASLSRLRVVRVESAACPQCAGALFQQ